MKQKIRTELISGAGNTFHIAYNQAAVIPENQNRHAIMKKIAQKACQENAADGFMFLEKDDVADLRWYFFNNDGSDAEMCGNATRCVGLIAESVGLDVFGGITLKTTAGIVRIKSLSNGFFEVIMSAPKKLSSRSHFFCDTGVPHLVIEYKDSNLFTSLTEDLKLRSREIRFSQEFAPRGTNVTYVERTKNPEKIRAVSYERGVEDFTKACGTGAMAAAFENFVEHKEVKTEVEMPGGVLTMDLSNINAPTMTGPAEKIGSYEYEVEI